MLLNLGLTADAAAAHMTDPSSQPSTPPVSSTSPSASTSASASASATASPPTSPLYSSFSLSAFPFLGSIYKSKQSDASASACASASASASGSGSGSALPAESVSDPAMSPVAAKLQGDSAEAKSAEAPPPPAPTVARPRVSSLANRKSTRPKTSYQLAHPAAHARHKRLKLRPRLLLQLQQVSHTPRPLPILDILPSTLYIPRLARKFPALFRGRHGLGPNDLIIVMSELYERTVSSIPEKPRRSDHDDDEHREVIATICQMLQEDALLKGKAEICLNFGPVWEATPLPSGSYEFVANTGTSKQVMRWALRSGKSRRVSSVNPTSGPSRDEGTRFTFSVIDPQTRRHPVIASMTRNQLEVFDEYAAVVRSNTGPTTPTSAMSVISDLSDADIPIESNDIVTLDDNLRTLIIITGIWVAFREGWSHNFSYGDPLTSPNGKSSLASPTSSRTCSPTMAMAKNENRAPLDQDDLTPMKEVTNNGKRCMSVSSVRRSNTTAPTEENKPFGSLSKRSNSTGAAFMERAKQRTASGMSNRLNRHSMFTAAGENGREIVVSRPQSLRQESFDSEDNHQRPNGTKNQTNNRTAIESNTKSTLQPDRDLTDRHSAAFSDSSKIHGKDLDHAKTKRRHRFSSIFTMFHRKGTAH